ncbi:ABC transporter permease [Salinicoccus kekensis]|uniref:ABC-2 type transport system permease protein n=1 Tax=Salinicoccus kekensis TaxID=714307 RepID=A0A285UNK7_9STAP|nr:ABC transporter permease subunit [Salinicoccus kekensis]SOC43470.1 ABC-2 type transport system permease protein [Salinicoccus kekensis]
MSQVRALFKKEAVESVRSFKLFALIIVFMIIGVVSPLTALLMPDILEAVMEDSGIAFELPPVSAFDSYSQFFSNANQMGLVVLVIIFGSILTHEFSRNTLVNLITKGLKKYNIILVKTVFAALAWTLAFVISALITYLYTIYYWGDAVHNLFAAFGLTWLFGVFLITLIMAASAVFKSSFPGVLITVLAVVIIMMIAGIHPDIAEFLPQYLIGSNMALLHGELEIGDMMPSIIATVISSILMIVLSILIFNKTEM